MPLSNATVHFSKHFTPETSEILTGCRDGIHIADIPYFTNAASGNDKSAILCKLRQLEEDRLIRVDLPCESSDLLTLDKGGDEQKKLCAKKPALWNVAAYESEWLEHPEYNDFMQPSSPVFHLKSFQAEIYANLLQKQLANLGQHSRILDAGAGVGRMVPRLSATGSRLDIVDSSAQALKTAWRVLCQRNVARYDIHRADASDLSFLDNNTFDLCLALELLCYLHDPEAAAGELFRICNHGGNVAISVENKTGSILGDRNLSIEDIASLCDSDTLSVPGYCHTKYYSRESAAGLAENAGFKVISVTGCHFLADGPFGALATEASLSHPEKRKRLFELEQICRSLGFIEKTARAWLVIAEKQ